MPRDRFTDCEIGHILDLAERLSFRDFRYIRERSRPGEAVRKLRWLIVPLITGAAVSIGAAPALCSELFEHSEPLEIQIQAPWKQLTRGMEVGRSATGQLSFANGGDHRSHLEVRISTRGLSRLEVCGFPPLTVGLVSQEIGDSPFQGEQTVHLTPQCRKDTRFRDYLVLEYLSFQAYRLLGVPALGVRLAVVEYLDTDGGRPGKPALAFLVEDLNQAAERLGSKWLEPQAVGVRSLAPENLALFGLFQFMLGNTDWSVLRGPSGEACCHNVGMLGQSETHPQLIPVPFDLDSTGLVDPPYASPAPSLPIRTVRQRLYRGFCATNSHLPPAIARLQDKRQEILALFEDEPLLSRAAKRKAGKYLDSFFEILEDPKKLQRRILEDCR